MRHHPGEGFETEGQAADVYLQLVLLLIIYLGAAARFHAGTACTALHSPPCAVLPCPDLTLTCSPATLTCPLPPCATADKHPTRPSQILAGGACGDGSFPNLPSGVFSGRAHRRRSVLLTRQFAEEVAPTAVERMREDSAAAAAARLQLIPEDAD